MLPQEERFGLRSQITRSAISIPSNIAEGSAKRSTKEKIKFMEVSLGSAFELETQILAISRRKWMDQKLIDDIIANVNKEQSMI